MNGIIVLDKPQGKTSHDMINFMRRMTGIRRIGHTGTLDPMATGVLPVCIGSATKVADMLTLSDKGYRTEFVLGITTDTEDISGTVLTRNTVNVSRDEIEKTVMSFVGEIAQIPPMYSAIKQNGKKLYELARQGIETEREERIVNIHSIDIMDIDLEKSTVAMDVICSKGTYIRTLCSDIGKKLGTGACMTSLRRTLTGAFSLDDAYTCEEIENNIDKLEDMILPVDKMFLEYPSIYLNEKQKKSIVNGVRMTWRDGEEGQCYRIYDSEKTFLCVSRCVDGRLQLEKSFWN